MRKIVHYFVWLLLIMVLQGYVPLEARDSPSSAPYLSGDTFRSLCTFQYDESTTSFSPAQVQPGDSIFVRTEYLASFFYSKHFLIQCPYILVTHNSDISSPGQYRSFLEEAKIVAWFAENPDCVHPKLHPLPIGAGNKIAYNGKMNVLEEVKKMGTSVPRNTLLYMNCTIETCTHERQRALDLFSKTSYCTCSPKKKWKSYLEDLLSTRFIVSPRGFGLDSWRTWEALYMGAIPIVKESPMDSLFEGLPVLIVKEWEEITEEFLKTKYEEMQKKIYDTRKLYTPYWIEQFQKCRQKAKTQV